MTEVHFTIQTAGSSYAATVNLDSEADWELVMHDVRKWLESDNA